MNKYLSNKKIILLYILPALTLFTVMLFYPLTQAVFTSFYKWDGFFKMDFIGFDNYRRLFQSPLFYKSISNQLLFALVLVFTQIPIATILAIAVSTAKVRGKSFLRVSYFLPVVLSVTVVCQLWLSMYNSEFGLINKILETLGSDYRQSWLTKQTSAIIAIAITNSWHFMGMHFAIIVAGIKGIPESFYEAAKVDGATPIQVHTRITIPLLKETYKLSLIMSITGGLNAFVQMYIMTSGGPGTNTFTMTYMMYRSAFGVSQFGYANAIATALVLFSLLATVIVNKVFAGEEITY